MSTSAPPFPVFRRDALAVPAAAFEVLGYLCVVGIGTLFFLLDWLTPIGAAVLTVLLVGVLIVLAWKHFDQGRHPCFLFLCTLMFFQGGGLLAYCLGAGNDPLRAQAMTPNPFYVSRSEIGLVLLLLVLTAICIYAPCRWKYRRVDPPNPLEVRRYLPYLYLVFFATLPIQLFKNYRYYQYVQEQGGYAFIFVNHAALAASVPFLVRLIPLVTFPAFVAIFVFEQRRKYVFLVTVLYFLTASFILLLGSRGATFTLIVALWYVTRMKSNGPPRILRLGLLVVALMLVANLINVARSGSDSGDTGEIGPMTFVVQQGVSISVTEIAVKYRDIFAPHAASYLFHDLLSAFQVADASNFVAGKRFDADLGVFLSPQFYSFGYGPGGSYVAEAYIVGGFFGVVVLSLLIGGGLRLLQTYSRSAMGLLVVAMVLPEVVWMPRASLLGWASVAIRNAISILLLIVGWGLYQFICSIRAQGDHTGEPGKGLPRGMEWSR
jgi:oligosaccharide repeat unit polymerase